MRKINNTEIYKKAIKTIADGLNVKNGTILITGALGLIGSCLVDVFLKTSFKIYALDLNKEKLIDRFGEENDRLVFIEQNICEPLANEYKFDYIINTASFADPKSYALYPAETILINILGTKNVLDYAKQNLCTRVLITSTFEVYGKLDKDFYGEDDFGLLDYNALRSCYPESKRTSEVLVRSYLDEYRVNGLIVRLSSIYGPTMSLNDSKAHAQFLFRGIKGEDIILKSDGKQKRTYTYVMDAVDAILYVLFNGNSGEAYNIANSESIVSISELANTIASLCGVRVTYDAPNELEQKGFSKPQNCVLLTDKITNLGWKPKYSISDGLKQTLDIMKEAYDEAN